MSPGRRPCLKAGVTKPMETMGGGGAAAVEVGFCRRWPDSVILHSK